MKQSKLTEGAIQCNIPDFSQRIASSVRHMSDNPKFRQLRVQLFLVFLTVLTALIQGSVVTDNIPLTFRACLLIPLTVCMGMFEKELTGAVLGTFAGMLWDTFSSGADGLRSVFLALTGCICGLLIHYFMRNNLLTALVFTSVSTVIYTLLAWIFGVVTVSSTGAFEVLLTGYLPNCLFAVAFLPVYYFIIRTAEKTFKYDYAENNGIRRD